MLLIYQEMMMKIDNEKENVTQYCWMGVCVPEEVWSIRIKRMSERVSRALI